MTPLAQALMGQQAPQQQIPLATMLAALMPNGQKLIPSRPPQQSQFDQTFPVPTPPGAWAPLSS